MADAVRWEDDFGRVRWQPQTNDGELLWQMRGTFYRDWNRLRTNVDRPVLYRFRWCARWKARRAERRRARSFDRVWTRNSDG